MLPLCSPPPIRPARAGFSFDPVDDSRARENEAEVKAEAEKEEEEEEEEEEDEDDDDELNEVYSSPLMDCAASHSSALWCRPLEK